MGLARSVRAWLAGDGPANRRGRLPRLGWDFHSHLVPGVDDGMRTAAESLEAIAGLRALGYRGAVTTPHVYPGVFDNDADRLEQAFLRLRAALPGDFDLRLAAEYFAGQELIDRVERGERLLSIDVGGQRLLLVEFPYTNPPPRGMDAVLAVRQAGYQPVLAHPERYRYLQDDPPRWLVPLQDMGVWLQSDIGALSGQYGDGPRATALGFLKQGLPVLWGTDLHRPHHLERHIVPALQVIAQKRGGEGDAALNAVLDVLDAQAATGP